MANRKRLADDAKSLQYFLNRSRVLSQYREFLRMTSPLESDVRNDVRAQIRAGFEMYRDVSDEKKVSGVLLRQAREQLKMVEDLVDTAVARQRVAENAAAAAAQSNGVRRPAETWMDAAAEDTQVNEEEKDTQDDIKGRMGVGWPWNSNKSVAAVQTLDLRGVKRR